MATEGLAFPILPISVSPLLGGAHPGCLARVDAVRRGLIMPACLTVSGRLLVGAKSMLTRDRRLKATLAGQARHSERQRPGRQVSPWEAASPHGWRSHPPTSHGLVSVTLPVSCVIVASYYTERMSVYLELPSERRLWFSDGVDSNPISIISFPGRARLKMSGRH